MSTRLNLLEEALESQGYVAADRVICKQRPDRVYQFWRCPQDGREVLVLHDPEWSSVEVYRSTVSNRMESAVWMIKAPSDARLGVIDHRLREIFRMSKPWALMGVLEKLCGFAEARLDQGWDGHGYEEVMEAASAGRDILRMMREGVDDGG